MSRGVALAQFRSETRKNPLGLKVSDTVKKRLEAAFENEKKSPQNSGLSETELAAYLLGYGLTLYEARESAGPGRFLAVVGTHGGDEEAAFKEILRRGLESWEAEQKAPRKK